ncbi:unnamed protein product [Alopecurus aequalis]
MSVLADSSAQREEGHVSAHAWSSSSLHGDSGTEAGGLTDDLLVEILSRVPAKSLCRFKCVSNHWLNLIGHPDHRKKLPQTLVGFFHSCSAKQWLLEAPIHFFHVSESRRRTSVSASFAFLPNDRRVDLLDSCNGLLLCRWYDVSTTRGDDFRYVVCNPATEQWVVLPDRSIAGEVGRVCLGFDPAVSHHFHVFVLLQDDVCVITGVDVYSSKSRRWVHKDRRCEAIRLIHYWPATAFLNGCLHFHTVGSRWGHLLAAVDMEGETWTTFDYPAYLSGGCVQRSQGHLHYATFEEDGPAGNADLRLVIYVMEDYDRKEWTPKHSIRVSDIFGGIQVDNYSYFHCIAIHPDSNLIFFIRGGRRDVPVMCYNMDRREAKLILDLRNGRQPYVPYVPLYSELQSLQYVKSL